MIRAFYGFNAANPQHLAWLKRKLANRDRYERRSRRRPPAEHNFSRSLARHLQSRKPPFSYWWEQAVEVGRWGVTGTPVMMKRRRYFWELMNDETRERYRIQYGAGAPR